MKKLIAFISVFALLFSACTAVETKISEEQAREIALNHAKVSAADATFRRTELDRERKRIVYELEFYSKDKREYDYEIDANTGEVITWESESVYD